MSSVQVSSVSVEGPLWTLQRVDNSGCKYLHFLLLLLCCSCCCLHNKNSKKLMRATKLCLVRECCSKCKTFGITSNDIKCCSSCTARCCNNRGSHWVAAPPAAASEANALDTLIKPGQAKPRVHRHRRRCDCLQLIFNQLCPWLRLSA